MVRKNTPANMANYWFLLFILVHIAAWTLAPTLVRHNLPMDSIEGATWGHQLEWGYDKNPFMNAWLTSFAVWIGGTSGWTVYLFSQLSVACGFWAIWQIAKKMLPPLYALLAVFLLEGVQYYNFHAIDFNDNTLEVGLWPLTLWFFYRAITEKNNTLSWILTGTFAALGMMTKYYTGFLLLPMFLFLWIYPETRMQFKRFPIYLGALIFVAIITPHIIWLFQHQFVTLDYAVDRVATEPSWFNHIFFPAQFIWQQFEAILPAIVLVVLALIGKKPYRAAPPLIFSSFNKLFLWFTAVGPLLLTVLVAAIQGMKLRAGWGQPLFSLWGIILVYLVQPHLTPARFYRFMGVLFVLIAIAIGGYSSALIRAPEPSSANFPGKTIAEQITTEWHEKYHTSLHFVAGTRWVAGNVAFYSTDKPAVYIDWNPVFSPWIDEAELKKDGAVFIWDLSDGKTILPTVIQARFKGLSVIETRHYTWRRNITMKPVEVLVAWLPPSS